MVKWVGIAYLKNIWWKLTFQNILNIWQTSVEMAKVLYMNKHHSTMFEKLQNGEHDKWAKTNIETYYIVHLAIERFMNEHSDC
jgi:hypothetical protein